MRPSSDLHALVSKFLARWLGKQTCFTTNGKIVTCIACLSHPWCKNWSDSQQIALFGFYLWYILVLAGFIAEYIRKRSPISVTWKAATRLSRHLQSCHVMLSGTQGKSLTNVINVRKPLSAMTTSNDIIVFTQVRHSNTLYTCTVPFMLLYIFRKFLKSNEPRCST